MKQNDLPRRVARARGFVQVAQRHEADAEWWATRARFGVNFRMKVYPPHVAATEREQAEHAWARAVCALLVWGLDT